MATSSTWWAWQKAASEAIPSAVLENWANAPSKPMRASNDCDEISIPQMVRVTVTCLVCAIESHATVRSYVTWAAVPVLRIGRSDQRTYGSRPPAGELMPQLPHCNSLSETAATFTDTRTAGREAGATNFRRL